MRFVGSKQIDGQPIYSHAAGILRICTGYGLYCSFEYEKNELKNPERYLTSQGILNI
jgi:hypothetical protein